jgi:hypothetical protein
MKGAIGTRRAQGKMVWWVEVYQTTMVGVFPGRWDRTHSAPHHLGTAMRMGTQYLIRNYLTQVRLHNEVTGDTISLNELHIGELSAFLFKKVTLA